MSRTPIKTGDALLDEVRFLHLTRTLLKSYTPIGVMQWLKSGNAHLDGRSPMEAWSDGDRDRVIDIAEWIEG